MLPFNKKFRTRYYYEGGKILPHIKMNKKHLSADSVRAILQPGEIVIPVKHAKKVATLLRTNGVKLPNMR